MDNKANIWSYISSVLEGNQTEEEQQQVECWIRESKRNEKFFNKLKKKPFNPDIEEEASNASERIYLKTQNKIREVLLKRKLRIWQYIAAAAISLLFIICGLDYWKAESYDPVYMESKSPLGSTTRLALSDGTIVELNAGSAIGYPTHFKGQNRTVSLTGEAYFEVAKDLKHPFIVETNQMKIQVLGTHFNVKSYEEDDKLTTTLLEGSICVNIESVGKPILLKPNQQIIYDKNTHKVEVLEVTANLYTAWKNGECYFEEEKLADIAKILERQFGIRIFVSSDKLKNQLFSGFFTKQEGLFHILNSFKRNRNLDYRQNDTGIEIYERVNK